MSSLTAAKLAAHPSRRRAGRFARWQSEYAARRIATFPVREDNKIPRVKGWLKVGLRGSGELALKFTDADAFGYCTGRRSNVTVLDIDTTDEKVLTDALRRHGQGAIIARTASGKFHVLYRYSGEGRSIRPWPKLPIDVLGDNGFVVAPPSLLAKGSYNLIHGHLDDLDQLKPMAGAPAKPTAAQPAAKPMATAQWHEMRRGDGRNRALWERCMRAGKGASLNRMVEIAREANKFFKEALTDMEVAKVATSAWQHDAAGLNFFTRPRIMLDHDIFDTLGAVNQDAVFLLLKLERHHGGNDRFVLSKTMCTGMGWGLPRWYSARDALVRAGVIVCLNHGGRGPNDPPVYVWRPRGAPQGSYAA